MLSFRPRHICRTARCAVKGRGAWTLAVVAGLSGMAACASPSRQMLPMDWPAFVASFEGVNAPDPEFRTPETRIVTYKDPKSGVVSAKRWFGAWCQSQKGESVAATAAQPSTPVVRGWFTGLSLKLNADQAAGRPHTPNEAVACVSKAEPRDLMYAMFFDEVPAPRGGAAGSLRHRYVFFTAEQALELQRYQQARSAERGDALARNVRERTERQDAATRALRQNPRVGDKTLIGVIIDVRLPMVLVQYDELYRQIGNRPQAEWVRVETLSAPLN